MKELILLGGLAAIAVFGYSTAGRAEPPVLDRNS